VPVGLPANARLPVRRPFSPPSRGRGYAYPLAERGSGLLAAGRGLWLCLPAADEVLTYPHLSS
jgi:hypothetical protein